MHRRAAPVADRHAAPLWDPASRTRRELSSFLQIEEYVVHGQGREFKSAPLLSAPKPLCARSPRRPSILPAIAALGETPLPLSFGKMLAMGPWCFRSLSRSTGIPACVHFHRHECLCYLCHFQRAQFRAARRRILGCLFFARLKRVFGQHVGAPVPAQRFESFFTFRSSMLMKLITTIRPPLFRSSGPVRSKRSSSPASSLTAIRSAMKVLVAGCRRPVLGTARNTTSARWSVLRMGRARTIALATFRALLSSPS